MQNKSSKATSPSATVRGILVLLLLICFVECATEERINNRGSKASLVQKINGWRSQRGGSCLSYGHSCWGAHGKRSGKAPASAPDWYITRILRQMAANNELNRVRNLEAQNDDDIYRMEVNNVPSNKLMRENEEQSADFASRSPEAKPMLDSDMLSSMKFWQIMRAASEEK